MKLKIETALKYSTYLAVMMNFGYASDDDAHEKQIINDSLNNRMLKLAPNSTFIKPGHIRHKMGGRINEIWQNTLKELDGTHDKTKMVNILSNALDKLSYLKLKMFVRYVEATPSPDGQSIYQYDMNNIARIKDFLITKGLSVSEDKEMTPGENTLAASAFSLVKTQAPLFNKLVNSI